MTFFSDLTAKIFAASTVAALVLAGTFALKNACLRIGIANLQKTHAEEKEKQAEANTEQLAKEIARANELTEKLNVLNAQLEKEKRDAKSENDRLRGQYAADVKRLRLQGATCTPRDSGPESQTSGPRLVADGSPEVEFSSELRQAIFDTRQLILDDQAKIKGLQSYITETCLK